MNPVDTLKPQFLLRSILILFPHLRLGLQIGLVPSLTVRNQVSQQCKTTGKLIVFHVLIFRIFDTTRENKTF